MVRCLLLRAALVIGALLAIGLLPVPVAPVAAAERLLAWHGDFGRGTTLLDPGMPRVVA